MHYRIVCLVVVCATSGAFANRAARQLPGAFGPYEPGRRNQITDVGGVSVGHVTLHSGSGPLHIGQGPVRTGVTVVIPATGDLWDKPVLAGLAVANGAGEASGFFWLKESRYLQAPIALTNTLSVGDVAKGLVRTILRRHPGVESPLPVVLECDDSSLNDIQGYHVKPEHAVKAVEDAKAEFAEGSVGAGTGMISFDFKAGIGSASRLVIAGKKTYRIGILVNVNLGTGTRNIFRVFGHVIGARIADLLPIEKPWPKKGAGSFVAVLATDAPFDSVQLSRLAQRTFVGPTRLGTPGYNGSGDFAVAFSTANRGDASSKLHMIRALPDDELNSFFEAIADASEEAVLNALLSAETMEGRDGNKVFALPLERLQKTMK